MSNNISIKTAIFVEKYLPLSVGILTLGAFFWRGHLVVDYAVKQQWVISSLYASVFDVSAIICAFLFSFFVFVKTTNNKILNAFRKRGEYNTLLSHFRRSIGASFLLTLLSIPYMVIVPKSSSYEEVAFYLIGFWVAFSAYTIAASFRSAYQFIGVLDAAYSQRFQKTPDEQSSNHITKGSFRKSV